MNICTKAFYCVAIEHMAHDRGGWRFSVVSLLRMSEWHSIFNFGINYADRMKISIYSDLRSIPVPPRTNSNRFHQSVLKFTITAVQSDSLSVPGFVLRLRWLLYYRDCACQLYSCHLSFTLINYYSSTIEVTPTSNIGVLSTTESSETSNHDYHSVSVIVIELSEDCKAEIP